jgi:sacsin
MSNPDIRHHPIFQATRNNIKTYKGPMELEILPSVIEPNVEHHRKLCDKLPGIYRFNSDFTPLCLQTAESSFGDSESFIRLIKTISKLSTEAGMELVDYVQSHLGPADSEVNSSIGIYMCYF